MDIHSNYLHHHQKEEEILPSTGKGSKGTHLGSPVSAHCTALGPRRKIPELHTARSKVYGVREEVKL